MAPVTARRVEWSRRGFLRASALGALGVGIAGCGAGAPAPPKVRVEVPGQVVSEAAPFRGSKLGFLSQKMYSDRANAALTQSLQAFADATGTTLQNSLVSGDTGDLIAKTDAAIKTGNGRDMAFFTDNRFIAQLHELGDLVDVSDVVAELSATLGEPARETKSSCVFDGKWFGIPYQLVGIGSFLRKDWLAEKGLPLKTTYDYAELRDICLEISDPGKRRFGWGMTINRSGDGNALVEDVINCYGGSIIADDGRTVAFNSPETVAAVEFLADIYRNPKYRPMLPPGIESWTDTSNNDNWLAGVLGFTSNQFSLYADAKSTGNPVYQNTHAFLGRTGPATNRPIGNTGQCQALVVFSGTKNTGLAKTLAKYLVSGTPLLSVAKEAPGLAMPAWDKVWDSDPFYTQGDPAFPMLKYVAQQPLPVTVSTGYHFPQAPSGGRQAVLQAYLLTDMMHDVLTGTPAKAAVATTHERISALFSQQGTGR